MPLPPAPLDDLARRQFNDAYGRPATIVVSAPGRVNLIGEHIDYNDGYVLPAAIDRLAVMASAPIKERVIRLRSHLFPEEAIIDLTEPPTRDAAKWSWVNYPLGVLAGFHRMGADVPGLEIWVQSSVPIGSGLSSSAALSVAFATLLEHVSGVPLTPKQKALLCQRAEHEFAGVPCGIMDQFATVLSRADHLLLIDCRSSETKYVPFFDEQVSILIANSGVSHTLASSEYARRKQQCDLALNILSAPSWRKVTAGQLSAASHELDESLLKRGRHVVSEIARTQDAVKAIEAGDWKGFGDLMYASHRSLQVDYEVSCAELDSLVSIGQDIGVAGGVYGARMTGAGFGGSTVSLIATEHAESILATYRERYKQDSNHALEAFVMRPSYGAGVAPSSSDSI